MEAERQRQATAAHAGQTEQPIQPGPPASQDVIQPEVAVFIARRNETREWVLDILPHRAWTGADAGDATYQGRRQIADGIEAVLLDRENETLVLVVTPAQAARGCDMERR